jgi:hypothetical protein
MLIIASSSRVVLVLVVLLVSSGAAATTRNNNKNETMMVHAGGGEQARSRRMRRGLGRQGRDVTTEKHYYLYPYHVISDRLVDETTMRIRVRNARCSSHCDTISGRKKTKEIELQKKKDQWWIL